MSKQIVDFSLDTATFNSPSFSAENFDLQIRTNGVQFIHWRSFACPIGLIDPDDIRRPHADHQGCSNGYVYTCAGTVTCVFQGNTKEVKEYDPGRIDGSTAQISIPRTYDDKPSCPVRMSFADRLYIKDEKVTVTFWQRFAKSAGDYDSLDYPIVCVHDFMDSSGKLYVAGQDFNVVDGKIHWLTPNRPSFDGTTQKGQVCAIRYEYRPFFYVQKMIHETRFGRSSDEFGPVSVIQLPQCALIVREIYFKTADRDPDAKNPNDPRQHDPASNYPNQYDSILNTPKR